MNIHNYFFGLRPQVPKEFTRDIVRDRRAGRSFIQSGGADSLKKSVRHQVSLGWLDTTLRDIRYGLRSLGRSPGLVGGLLAGTCHATQFDPEAAR